MKKQIYKRITAVFIVITVFVALFASCTAEGNSESGDEGKKLRIISTIFPPYDFARAICGGNADVTMLVTPNVEVHGFEPTLSDIALINSCDLFLYIGGEGDAWVDDLLEASGGNINSLPLISSVSTHAEELKEGMQEEEGEEEEEAPDEHIWTSPVNAGLMTDAICEAVCALDTQNEELYRANASEYKEKLDRLDSEFREIVSGAPKKTILFEGRFPFLYLVREYGLDYYAALAGCAGNTEVSFSTIAFLTEKVKEMGLTKVFYIEFSDENVCDTICEATGAEKLLLHSCHNVSTEDFNAGVSYLELMHRNAENLREALYD